jgi:hypothetical protein
MEAGETMVEIIRSTAVTNHPTTSGGDTHEGIKQYYIQKIEELQVKTTRRYFIGGLNWLLFSSMSRKKVKIYDVYKLNGMN